jgi:4-amino-4-deoxy-L-arabinose transferase-like glycosyltransferase
MSQASGHSRRSPALLISILLLVLVAFGLRLLYVTRISPYIDEFTSIWAAKLILQKGLPLTPAGAIYHRGILFSYVEALSTSLFGFSEEASRMPSVFIAVVTVPCLYLVGRRMLGDRSGLFAVAFLSFAPQAVVWGARARMYALLQLLALLAVYFLYAAIVESRKGIHLVLFVVCFTGAIFAQEQAVLLCRCLGLLALVDSAQGCIDKRCLLRGYLEQVSTGPRGTANAVRTCSNRWLVVGASCRPLERS